VKKIKIYANEVIEQRVNSATKAFRSKIPFDIEDHYVDTQFGKTHVIETGTPGKPPLIVLHGGATNGICALYFIKDILEDFHVFCPDIPGHAGSSEKVFINPRDNSFGVWLGDVLTSLSFESAPHFMGISYGGFIIQRYLSLHPDKANKVAFMVPGGIINPNGLGMIGKVLIPQIAYKITKNEKYLDTIVNHLFSDINDDDLKDFIYCIFKGMKLDNRPMKRSSIEEMKQVTSPVLVIASDNDIVFPGTKLQSRAKQLFGNKLKFVLLNDSKHSPSTTPESLKYISNTIKTFLHS